MASRAVVVAVSRAARAPARSRSRSAAPARALGTSAARRDAVAAGGAAASPLPPRKPVGALRGGLFGFFLGSSLSAAGIYYYAVQEYKVSNELLTEDIYTLRDVDKLTGRDGQALQNAVERLSTYVTTLEEKMDALERRKN
ncbi:hypothetical protein VTH06DRAFT_8032 [Thermothelomyces fergusii]